MQIDVTAEADGQRLDIWLSGQLGQSRSQIKRLVDDGAVQVNGLAARKTGARLCAGDCVSVSRSSRMPQPMDMDLEIVFEDDWIVIVNKPAGLLVYPVKDPKEPTLVNGLLAHTSLSHFAGAERPGLVHRIDRDTSGLVIAAKSDEVHEKLYHMLEKHDIDREYIGIAQHPFDVQAGVIDRPIAADYVHGVKRKVVDTGGQGAITHYRCVLNTHDYALMAFKLETGRTHQIRVHMASIGHPLVGDALYGKAQNAFGLKGQALHAHHLVFTHPVTGQTVDVRAQAPFLFRRAVGRVQSLHVRENKMQ